MNNPVNFSDPTGHKCVSAGAGDCLNDNGKPINAAGTKPVVNKPKDTGGPKLIPPTEEEIKNNVEACAKTMGFGPTCLPTPDIPDTIHHLKPKYNFIAPWRLDKLDAIGVRYDAYSLWLLLAGGDFSVDLIHNLKSRETTLFVNFSLAGGLGFGTDSGGGILLGYAAPDNNALARGSKGGATANITPELIGGQASYSVSNDSNVTGNYGQLYFFGVSVGEELSGGANGSYALPIFTCQTSCYWSVK